MSQTEKIYFEPELFISDLESDIRLAKKTIDIEMYIWAPDDFTFQLLKELEAAVARGVLVRVLIDGYGSMNWINQEMEKMKNSGVLFKVYHRFPKGMDTAVALATHTTTFWKKMNRRNHRKTFIIDDSIAYFGSFNVYKASLAWKETIVRIEDKDVDALVEMYEYTWLTARYTKILKNRPLLHSLQEKILASSLMTTQSLKLRRHYKKIFKEKFKEAKDYVWLMTPYWNPPPFLHRILLKAAKRGVDVRLILPARSDLPFMRWYAQIKYDDLIQAGVKVYEYLPQFLHAKMALFDHEGIIGSGNLNYRSFYRDLELNIVIREPHLVDSLKEQFVKDLEISKPMRKGYPIPQWKRAAAAILSPFKGYI